MTNYVFFANGFEEIEALTIVDVLRRAGMEVKTIAVHFCREVTGAHGVTVITDGLMDDVKPTDGWLILPGGMPGATNLKLYEPLGEMLARHEADGKKIAAICASPSVVLAPIGLLDERKATCYPGMECKGCGAIWVDDMVVTDGNVITGRGPAAAIEFALAIVAHEMGPEVAKEIADGMLVP
ncbi:MAG: DJ-1/PfpI family protein [Muribaculaceae bacterium]|nr:DJ-1/PfpI family protein [Muribaculaceae bacterium]